MKQNKNVKKKAQQKAREQMDFKQYTEKLKNHLLSEIK